MTMNRRTFLGAALTASLVVALPVSTACASTGLFDLRTAKSRFLLDIHPKGGSDIQKVVRASNGDWYSSQHDSKENTIISRMGPDGQLKGCVVKIVGGGHGSYLDLQQRSDGLWVWACGPKGTVLRFKWPSAASGTVSLTAGSPGVVKVKTFTSNWASFSLDVANDRIAYRVAKYGTYTLRRLSDVDRGINRVLGSFKHVSPVGEIFQGWTFVNNTVVIYAGMGSITKYKYLTQDTGGAVYSGSDPGAKALVYRFGTGHLYTADISGWGKDHGQYWEPESLAPFRTPTGLVLHYGEPYTDRSGNHHAAVYRIEA